MNTIVENNKLLAEFMGFVFTQDNKANPPKIIAPYPPIECFKYHTDWNWIMEVVEKIEQSNDIIEFTIFGDSRKYYQTIIKQYKETERITIVNIECKTKLETVYNACVEFVKWYNKQQQL